MKSMRVAWLLVLVLLAATPAFADITVKMTMTTTGGPAAMDMSMVSYIKGMKMRSDVKMAGQDMSMYVDIAAKLEVMVNNVTKEVMDLAAVMAQMPSVGDATVSVKPNGQTKQVLGRTCAGYTVEMSMPMTMQDETITTTMTGTAWIAKDAPGAAEYEAFNKAAVGAGLASGLFAQGPQAKGIAKMQAAFAENGIPLEQEMQVSMSGTGQMAQMMAQSGIGSMKMTMTVTSLSVEPIPDGTFDPPAGAVKK